VHTKKCATATHNVLQHRASIAQSVCETLGICIPFFACSQSTPLLSQPTPRIHMSCRDHRNFNGAAWQGQRRQPALETTTTYNALGGPSRNEHRNLHARGRRATKTTTAGIRNHNNRHCLGPIINTSKGGNARGRRATTSTAGSGNQNSRHCLGRT